MGQRGNVLTSAFGKGAFVCSKPLQFLACAGIVRRYAVERPEIHVATHGLAGADAFLEFVRTSAYGRLFAGIHGFPSHAAVADHLRTKQYDSLFIEDDRVSLYHLYAPLKRHVLTVFEEGIGTYRSDMRSRLSGLRRLRWMATSLITGCGLQFGDGRRTDHVIVQYPEVYTRLNPRNGHKVLPASALTQELAELSNDWRTVVEATGIRWPGVDCRVAIVLGTWGGAPTEALTGALRDYDEVYYKAHPHDGLAPPTDGVQKISTSWLPAEVLIDRLAQSCRELTVFHFSSSVYLNCLGGYHNVTFIDLLSDPRFVEVCYALDHLVEGGSNHVDNRSRAASRAVT